MTGLLTAFGAWLFMIGFTPLWELSWMIAAEIVRYYHLHFMQVWPLVCMIHGAVYIVLLGIFVLALLVKTILSYKPYR
jgi:hypothetical protein